MVWSAAILSIEVSAVNSGYLAHFISFVRLLCHHEALNSSKKSARNCRLQQCLFDLQPGCAIVHDAFDVHCEIGKPIQVSQHCNV